jgi:hypothetical protein
MKEIRRDIYRDGLNKMPYPQLDRTYASLMGSQPNLRESAARRAAMQRRVLRSLLK